MLEWMKDPELRRRVQVGLNKGEAKNALARAVFPIAKVIYGTAALKISAIAPAV
jgi:hypothetical protein